MEEGRDYGRDDKEETERKEGKTVETVASPLWFTISIFSVLKG